MKVIDNSDITRNITIRKIIIRTIICYLTPALYASTPIENADIDEKSPYSFYNCLLLVSNSSTLQAYN